jgi:predicted nucleic acid-binding protein
VSGDKDLLVLESIRGIPILTADEFLRRGEEGEA